MKEHKCNFFKIFNNRECAHRGRVPVRKACVQRSQDITQHPDLMSEPKQHPTKWIFFFSIGTRPCNFNMGVVNLLEFGKKKKLRYSPMESLQPNLFVYIWVSWCIQMKLWANVPDFVLEPVAEKPRFLLLRLNCFGKWHCWCVRETHLEESAK